MVRRVTVTPEFLPEGNILWLGRRVIYIVLPLSSFPTISRVYSGKLGPEGNILGRRVLLWLGEFLPEGKGG